MKNLAKWKLDKAKEQNGVEVLWDYDPETQEKISFVIARSGGANTEYQKLYDERMKTVRRDAELGIIISDEAYEQLTIEVFVKTVLKGWAGIKGDDDQPWPFNEENAIKLFTEFPDMFKLLREKSHEWETFRQKALESEAKN